MANKAIKYSSLSTILTKLGQKFVKTSNTVELTPISIDNTPASGSNNLITSAGVYNADATLQTEINNLKNIGRFLAIWDASTGTPTSEPTTSPYAYKVGDYYRIGVAGTRNPASNLTYIIGGTNWETGEQLNIGDVVYCSNVTESATTWRRQASSGGGTVQDVQVNGTSVLASGIANIPVASQSTLGVVKVEPVLGVTVSNFGQMQIQASDALDLVNKNQNFKPIVPSNLDKAIMEGLGNNSLTWSAAYKQSARNTIGAGAPITIEILEGGDS